MPLTSPSQLAVVLRYRNGGRQIHVDDGGSSCVRCRQSHLRWQTHRYLRQPVTVKAPGKEGRQVLLLSWCSLRS